jgi:pimeloyl-ACP methyl ester carboxylesterase
VLHVVIAFDVAGIGFGPRMGTDTSKPLVLIGNVLLIAFAGGLLLAGRGAVLRPGARRVANVVWDVIAFWPRAAHPMAPPPYSQRAVRDFADRITWHLEHGGAERLLVAGHSQGSLISVAALLRVPQQHYGRIALITHGSQLQHAYSRAFPGYVNAPLLRWLLRTLDGRWLNLYRDTDPVGGPVLSWHRSSEADGLPWTSTRLTGEGQETADDGIGAHGVRCCGREWRLLDPAVVDPRRRPWPGSRGHSDIPADVVWPYAVDAVWQGDAVCPVSVPDQQSDGQPAEQTIDSDPRDV